MRIVHWQCQGDLENDGAVHSGRLAVAVGPECQAPLRNHTEAWRKGHELSVTQEDATVLFSMAKHVVVSPRLHADADTVDVPWPRIEVISEVVSLTSSQLCRSHVLRPVLR